MHNTRLGHVTFLLHYEHALVEFPFFVFEFFRSLVMENYYLH